MSGALLVHQTSFSVAFSGYIERSISLVSPGFIAKTPSPIVKVSISVKSAGLLPLLIVIKISAPLIIPVLGAILCIITLSSGTASE